MIFKFLLTFIFVTFYCFSGEEEIREFVKERFEQCAAFRQYLIDMPEEKDKYDIFYYYIEGKYEAYFDVLAAIDGIQD